MPFQIFFLIFFHNAVGFLNDDNSCVVLVSCLCNGLRSISSQNPYEKNRYSYADVSLAVQLIVAIELTLVLADVNVTF